MKIQFSSYADFKASVADLGAPDAVLYVNAGPSNVYSTAIYLTGGNAVLGGNPSSPMGVTPATFVADFPAATLVSSFSVT